MSNYSLVKPRVSSAVWNALEAKASFRGLPTSKYITQLCRAFQINQATFAIYSEAFRDSKELEYRIFSAPREFWENFSEFTNQFDIGPTLVVQRLCELEIAGNTSLPKQLASPKKRIRVPVTATMASQVNSIADALAVGSSVWLESVVRFFYTHKKLTKIEPYPAKSGEPTDSSCVISLDHEFVDELKEWSSTGFASKISLSSTLRQIFQLGIEYGGVKLPRHHEMLSTYIPDVFLPTNFDKIIKSRLRDLDL